TTAPSRQVPQSFAANAINVLQRSVQPNGPARTRCSAFLRSNRTFDRISVSGGLRARKRKFCGRDRGPETISLKLKEALALVQEEGDRPQRKQGDRRPPMRHVFGGGPLSALREVMRPAVKRTDSRSDYARPLLVIVLSTCSTNREYDRLKALLAATRT